jgi:hypothetical protein
VKAIALVCIIMLLWPMSVMADGITQDVMPEEFVLSDSRVSEMVNFFWYWVDPRMIMIDKDGHAWLAETDVYLLVSQPKPVGSQVLISKSKHANGTVRYRLDLNSVRRSGYRWIRASFAGPNEVYTIPITDISEWTTCLDCWPEPPATTGRNPMAP